MLNIIKLYKSIALLFISMIIILSFNSCAERIIAVEQDELTMYSWENTDKYDCSIRLSFKGDEAKLEITNNNGEKTILQGNYYISDNKINIVDKELLTDIFFEYNLEGNKVTLTYDGDSIELKKAEKIQYNFNSGET